MRKAGQTAGEACARGTRAHVLREHTFYYAESIIKGDLPSMEHPFFSLRAGDTRVREYKYGEAQISIKPGAGGCATIHDKDIWFYCIGKVIESLNKGEKTGRTVRFTAYDFLAKTRRGVSGDSYKRLAEALGRLRGTSIETNIETAGLRERAGFGLIDDWRIVEKDNDERMIALEVTLPRWLFRAIKDGKVLTVNPGYFCLRSALARRLYELARKHCGRQLKWKVSVQVLWLKSGSADVLRNFRNSIKLLCRKNNLPDYRLSYDPEEDSVTFSAR